MKSEAEKNKFKKILDSNGKNYTYTTFFWQKACATAACEW
jgi:hypothetical protein